MARQSGGDGGRVAAAQADKSTCGTRTKAIRRSYGEYRTALTQGSRQAVAPYGSHLFATEVVDAARDGDNV